MTKRALLIGSPFGDLAGPSQDVKRLIGIFEPRGFEIRRCIDQGATRGRILSAYRSLIDDTVIGDVVAIYYSGHGARSLDEAYTPPDEFAAPKRYHHFIVPMDFGESSEGDFRGILSLELSSLLAQLTAKTRNVTVIFDCCHSAGMTRDLRLRPKGLPKDWFVGAFGHLERITHSEIPGFPLDRIAVEGNPQAVRVMAALPSQLAWEYEDSEGAYGLMTHALIRALEESQGRPVTWNAVIRRVRELVQLFEPSQYPDVEGPSSRFVFDLEEADMTGIVPIEMSDDGPRLRGGQLLGISVGDEYAIMPAGFQKVDREHELARATVTHVNGAWSLVTLEPSSAKRQLPSGAQAFPRSRAHNKKPIILKVGTAIQPALAEAIASSELVRLPAENERVETSELLAVIEESNGHLLIKEKDDRDFISPLPKAPGVTTTVAKNLDRLARARVLETLESGRGRCELTFEYELDWGRVVSGRPMPLPMNGAGLFVGDRVFVRVRNNSRSTLYVSVFDIGLAGKIELLTRHHSSSGVELPPDGPPFTLGYREGLGWKGVGPISWPSDVPKDDRPRAESLVVIVSDRPQDLRALESPGMAAAKGAGAGRSDLEQIVDQLVTGRAREIEADDPPPEVHYSVEHIYMLVDPNESRIPVTGGTADERILAIGDGARSVGVVAVPAARVNEPTSFLIDERPLASAAYRRSRGSEIPTAVAVQLGEIVVHSNRALLSTDVRVDALIITGGETPNGIYRAGTAQFERINDGDRLPLDNLLLYNGPASAFIDLAVWVSRDDKHSLSLNDMLKQQLGSLEFKEAAVILAGLVVAAPTAGAIVGGLGAATTVVNIAYTLLSAAVSKSIGLYRTSFLANDRFGVGRHPASGVMRAQDFSFWYQVTEVK